MNEIINCPNCGAPITGVRCKYCGTQFFNMADIEYGEAGYIRVKYNGRIITAKAVPKEIDFYHAFDNIDFLLDGKFFTAANQRIEINVAFDVVQDENGVLWREWDCDQKRSLKDE